MASLFGGDYIPLCVALQVTTTLEAFINFPGIASCMAKMMLGFNCGHYVRLELDQLEEAKRRVRQDMAFVGLSEHWNASICLFHRKYGGRMDATELANLRPGTEDAGKARHDVFQQVLQAQKAPAGSSNDATPRRRLLQAPLDFLEEEDEERLRNEDDAVGGEESVLPLHTLGQREPGSVVAGLTAVDPMSRQERNSQVRSLTQVPKSAADDLLPEHDPLDYAIYEVALEVFQREMKTYGLAPVSFELERQAE
jgi:hypothetical protein